MILNVSVKSACVILAFSLLSVNGYAWELTGYSAAEYRYFQYESLNSEATQHNPSVVLAPEFYHDWDEGNQNILISAFLRIDSEDAERTHLDLREARWLLVKNDWELQLGIGKVYWGVTESQHLVDVINQTDLVENSDTEDKLGQPMINLSFFKNWGTVDLFVLPYFRERTFAGKKGRLRSQLVVESDKAQYESSAKQHHLDIAARWSHTLGDWDIGLSHFYGTNRAPLFIPNQTFTRLIPYYEIMHQTAMDIQHTRESWLWKLEVIRRETSLDTFTALTGGLEYTFYGVFDSNIDVGLIAEYLWDDRDNELATPFEDDLMIGTRLAWNDEQSTELLLGVIQDVDSSDSAWNIEASRRIGNRWKVSLEGRFFKSDQTNSTLYQIRDDDYIQLELARYF
ncbi:MAG: hypothetical protein HRT92_07495 [Piscirickettsiaceae bacterium]|nr:hypothetical protein [Piscirickettsiaceae bacterium]